MDTPHTSDDEWACREVRAMLLRCCCWAQLELETEAQQLAEVAKLLGEMARRYV